MVLLVISAMATTSRTLYPHINNDIDAIAAERYKEISKYLLLNDGTPADWGQNGQITPETFGLAKSDSQYAYELDIDKVTRLNGENLYGVTYAQIFTALKMPDVSFEIEIKPIFEVLINLTASSEEANETVYEFNVLSRKNGVPVSAELRYYVVAENYLQTNSANASSGETSLNVAISNTVKGPALLIVFARTSHNTKIMSFGVSAFAHNSKEPKRRNTFLRLSPLNHTLNASLVISGINLSRTYALTFNYDSILTQVSNNNQSAEYSIPHFLDSSPILIIATGWNSTVFFTEWTAYPQIPLHIGANFTDSSPLSNVFAKTSTVTINYAIYECTLWIGGPRE
jgi:hypothetical protein